ncbi:hypothetical protein [Geobacter sulfurreducens]|jgi:hypothetical protein|nr:hypothetical protein [Geobacter sulfurreducens]
MVLPLQRKGIALLLLLLMVSVALGGAVCLGADHHPTHAAADTVAPTAGDEAPCCPDEEGHSDGDHCQSCLSCPCQAPLAGDGLSLSYAPSIHVLSFSEHRVPPPDVYLSKFVPPAESRLIL